MARRLLLLGGLLAAGPAALEFLDPVAVGHVREFLAAPGDRPRGEMRTLSVEPAVFYVPGILSEQESDELVALAQRGSSWQDSSVTEQESLNLQRQLARGGRSERQILRRYDYNRDGLLDAREMGAFAESVFNMPNYDHAAFAAHALGGRGEHGGPDMRELGVPLGAAASAGAAAYFAQVQAGEPHRRSRFSRQTWIGYGSPLLQVLLDRVRLMTGLPESVVNGSEPLQVVHYPPRGHYSCHHDGSPDMIDEGVIRFATLAIYLNNVTRGGETVFPGALREEAAAWGPEEWGRFEMRCQPTEGCTHLGGLKVQPRQGDGLFWYNVRPAALAAHPEGKRRRTSRRSFGDEALAWGSLHCGAEVLEGEKWMANLWLRADRIGGGGEDGPDRPAGGEL